MNIDKKPEIPDTDLQIWPATYARVSPCRTTRTLRRHRAAARAKWPMYLPDVAYRIEGLPQPKRPYGRTWISRKIKISFLRCLGPRCSRRRTCGRTGQQRNDLDARRGRECGGIDTNGSACAVPPHSRISSG